jgi:hypothetical protein
MKRTVLILTLALMIVAAMFAGGCIRKDISEESGNMVTRTFDYTGFTRIKVGYAFKADITRSDSYSVSVVINENMAERLKVNKVGDTLEIGLKEPAWNFWGVRNRPQVTVTLPDLHGLNFSGASEGNVQGFKSSSDFDLEVSGASNLDIEMETGSFNADVSGASSINGYVKATSSDMEISGASNVKLKGSGGDIRLDVSGASSAKLEEYAVTNTKVELSGASTGRLEISGRLDANVSGASTLVYGGNPTLGKIDISGASSIKPK